MEIHFNEPYISGKEISYIEDVFKRSYFSGNGYYTNKCQELIEHKYNINKVLLTHSCTGALEMAALLMELNKKDEIILPSYTFCSTATAFLRSGAKLVFAEISEDDLMLDPEDVKNKLSPNTKVIVPVHYGGSCAKTEDIKSIVKGTDISIIEDAAQGFASFSPEKEPLGSIGKLGCISFHETKNFHSGLGGAIYLNDKSEEFLNKAIQVWQRGTNRQSQLSGEIERYTWTELGSSFYPSELQSACLLAQLETIEENVKTRSNIYECYLENLIPLEHENYLKLYKHDTETIHNHHAVIIFVKDEKTNNMLRQYLLENGIEAYIGYVPLHSSPMGKKLGYKNSDLSKTEEISKRIIRLPMHNNLSEKNVKKICMKISNFFNQSSNL